MVRGGRESDFKVDPSATATSCVMSLGEAAFLNALCTKSHICLRYSRVCLYASEWLAGYDAAFRHYVCFSLH